MGKAIQANQCATVLLGLSSFFFSTSCSRQRDQASFESGNSSQVLVTGEPTSAASEISSPQLAQLKRTFRVYAEKESIELAKSYFRELEKGIAEQNLGAKRQPNDQALEEAVFGAFEPKSSTVSSLSDAKVFLFGEIHHDDNVDLYARILRQIDISNSVILIERSSDFEPVVFGLTDAQSSALEKIRQSKSPTAEIEALSLELGLIEQRRSQMEEFRKSSKPFHRSILASLALTDNCSIIPIDCPKEKFNAIAIAMYEGRILSNALTLLKQQIPLHPLHRFALKRINIAEDEVAIADFLIAHRVWTERACLERQETIVNNFRNHLREARALGKTVVCIMGDGHVNSGPNQLAALSELQRDKFVSLAMYRRNPVSYSLFNRPVVTPESPQSSNGPSKSDTEALIKYFDKTLARMYLDILGEQGEYYYGPVDEAAYSHSVREGSAPNSRRP